MDFIANDKIGRTEKSIFTMNAAEGPNFVGPIWLFIKPIFLAFPLKMHEIEGGWKAPLTERENGRG